jgi:2-polyprenyl-3-methyl-5-hydroxy-6-metoxy-1,4-benzoquinol methylase
MNTPARDTAAIRTRPCPDCYLCGVAGVVLYDGLTDRLFGAPGRWRLKRCPSASCGLIWLDPMPLEEEIGKAYASYYTHENYYAPQEPRKHPDSALRRSYASVKESYLASTYGYDRASEANGWRLLGRLLYLLPGRRADLDFSVMYLPYLPSGRLLEVGCGGGDMLKAMSKLGWRVEGVDFDPKAVERARAQGLTVSLGTLEAQAYPDESFDAIAMIHVIEHVHEPLELLRECRRVLKPGGRLLVVTPNAGSWGHRRFKEDWRGLEPPRHLHIFTVPAIDRLMAPLGFKKHLAVTTIRDANNLLIASRSLKRTGRYVMGAPQPGSVRLWGRAVQHLEWALLSVNPHLGEEIALIAEK